MSSYQRRDGWYGSHGTKVGFLGWGLCTAFRCRETESCRLQGLRASPAEGIWDYPSEPHVLCGFMWGTTKYLIIPSVRCGCDDFPTFAPPHCFFYQLIIALFCSYTTDICVLPITLSLP